MGPSWGTPGGDHAHGLRRDHDDVSVSDYDHAGDQDHDREPGFSRSPAVR